jgi:hypothetical protein
MNLEENQTQDNQELVHITADLTEVTTSHEPTETVVKSTRKSPKLTSKSQAELDGILEAFFTKNCCMTNKQKQNYTNTITEQYWNQ